MLKRYLALAATLLLFIGLAQPAHAQASRTWVSGVGDDLNPCSRTAPCKTFAGAISKTAAGGEINVIDPGAFGAVTITKSVSIVAEGQTAGILGSLVNGIIINALDTDRITLDGLDIEGFGSGLNGIRVLKAKQVVIRNTSIRNFRGNTGFGIDVQSVSPVDVYVENSHLSGNMGGVHVKNAAVANRVFIERSTMTGNVTFSLKADGNQTRAFINASMLRGAATDLLTANNGKIASYLNNNVGTGNSNDPNQPAFK